MKFPRNARMFRGHLDAAPFAGVFFCLLIFILLTSLIYTPGVRIDLPPSLSELPGVDGPAVKVAMVASGQLYFQNQSITEKDLLRRLQEETGKSSQPLTLVVAMDRDVTVERMNRLLNLAKEAGVGGVVQETQSRIFDPPATKKSP